MRQSYLNVVALAALSASLAACGGGGGGVASTPAPVVTTPTTPTTTTPPVTTPPVTTTNFNTTEYSRSNAASQAQAISAYQAGATGRGVIAAVIDSGINQNSDEFAGRISAASADVAGTRTIQDEDGHGTAVSSVLLGAKNDTGMHGVAFDATLLALRTDSPGSCADTSANGGCDFPDNAIARGVDRAIANGARVINISLGGSPANANLSAALDRATAAGIVLVFSAGNDGVDNPTLAQNPDPIADIGKTAAARGLVLAVGSVDSSHVLSNFSNKAGNGAAYYVVALGTRVRAPDHTGASFLWDGTSFSAPVVSGAVALLAQAFPTLTGRQIVDLIIRTADDRGAVGVDGVYGNGELNLARAFAPQGAASLAGSKTPVSYIYNGMTSAPMGDAGQKGLSAVIRDGYGRAYTTDLGGTFARAPVASRLKGALQLDAQSSGVAMGPVALTMSVTGSTQSSQLDRLSLTHDQRAQARALAGTVALNLSRKDSIALGISQRGSALLNAQQIQRGGAFLMAEAARDAVGFSTNPDLAFAYRHAFGKTGLTISGEAGNARLWELDSSRLLRDRYRNYAIGQMSVQLDRRFGPFSLILGATRLTETHAILGAKLDLLAGQAGATTWFGDAGARLNLTQNWALNAAYRHGATRVGKGGLHQRADWLQTNAWSVDIVRSNLLRTGDGLSLRLSQPLRITRGALGLTLPYDYNYFTDEAQFDLTRFNLAPTGRERDVEAGYRMPMLGGAVSANGFWRKDPGNVANAADDIGFAIRFARGF